MRWPQAVSAGKTYLLASFANDLVWAGAEAGIIALTTSDFSQLSYGFKDLLHSFAFFAIWHTYLSDSERVAAIFPKDRRIALGRDSAMLYGFLAMNAVIAILCFMPVEDEIVPRTDGTQEEDTYYDAITSDVRSPADAT